MDDCPFEYYGIYIEKCQITWYTSYVLQNKFNKEETRISRTE